MALVYRHRAPHTRPRPAHLPTVRPAMIRCMVGNHLIQRYPCPVHRTDRRNKQVAQAVIARDQHCVHCGTTTNLEAGHKRGYEKRTSGVDDARYMEAQCFSYNRTGRCKT